MKALPLLTLVCAAQLVVPATFAATSYIAEGVDTSNILNSTRFYDNMKGAKAWNVQNGHVSDSTWDFYQEDPEFLGKLTSRTTLSSVNSADYLNFYTNMVVAMNNLRNDSLTCWYQVAANMTQYWQSYYGIFAKDPTTLAYGYNYDKKYIYALEGGQSLQVGLVLYDNFQDVASEGENNATPALEWYFKGTTHSYQRTEAPTGGTLSNGGFFSDYFPSGDTSKNASKTESTTNNETVLSALEAAFDLTKSDGTYSANSQGQIAYLGVKNHAVTCYGFNVAENGMITSVLIADSDDYLGNKDTVAGTDGYALVTLYVKAGNDGKLYLYEDEACTNTYGDRYIDFVGYIDTPDELKKMYADYTSAETPLTWNGKLETWNSSYEEATTEKLPTTATGWEVYVDAGETAHDKYYATYYDPSRKVEFNDYAKYEGNAPTITVSGNVQAGGMVLSGEENNYTFTKDTTTGGSITLSGDITKTGSGTDTFSDIAVSANKLIVSNGTLTLAEGTKMTLAGGVLISAGELVIEDGNAFGTSGTEISIDGGQLNVADNVKLAATAITIVLDSVYKEKAAITGSGSLAAGTTLAIGGNFDALGIPTTSVEEYSYLLWDRDSLALAEDKVTLTDALAKSLAEAGWGYKINVDQGLLTLAIPEPSAFGLFAGLGALTLVVARRRRRK